MERLLCFNVYFALYKRISSVLLSGSRKCCSVCQGRATTSRGGPDKVVQTDPCATPSQPHDHRWTDQHLQPAHLAVLLSISCKVIHYPILAAGKGSIKQLGKGIFGCACDTLALHEHHLLKLNSSFYCGVGIKFPLPFGIPFILSMQQIILVLLKTSVCTKAFLFN